MWKWVAGSQLVFATIGLNSAIQLLYPMQTEISIFISRDCDEAAKQLTIILLEVGKRKVVCSALVHLLEVGKRGAELLYGYAKRCRREAHSFRARLTIFDNCRYQIVSQFCNLCWILSPPQLIVRHPSLSRNETNFDRWISVLFFSALLYSSTCNDQWSRDI